MQEVDTMFLAAPGSKVKYISFYILPCRGSMGSLSLMLETCISQRSTLNFARCLKHGLLNSHLKPCEVYCT